MQVATNLDDHRASTILLHDDQIANAHLPETPVVVLRNDLQKPSDLQDGLLPATPFKSVFFDRMNASVIFSPVLGPFTSGVLPATLILRSFLLAFLFGHLGCLLSQCGPG